ncbi:endonuclease 4 [uncultured archaeon]|nr:endonuclease 4 [uncultured archaeon]
MPEIYVSTSCLKGTGDLREILEVYSAHGIRNVELTGGLEYIRDLDGLLGHYPGTNFIIHNYFPPPREPFLMNLAAQDEMVREKSLAVCKRALDLCSRFGGGLYSFHPGFRVEGALELNFDLSGRRRVPYQDAFYSFTRSIEEISDYAMDRGVPIALENLEHKNEAYMMTRPEEFVRFQEIFPEVGVLLDLGHLKIASKRFGFEAKEFLSAVKDRVLAMNIHENDGIRDLHLEPLGSALMGHLEKLKCETVVLECRGLSMERILINLRALEQVCG